MARGRNIREVTAPMERGCAILHADGYAQGWAPWTVGVDNGRLLGGKVVERGAAELLGVVVVVVVGG